MAELCTGNETVSVNSKGCCGAHKCAAQQQSKLQAADTGHERRPAPGSTVLQTWLQDAIRLFPGTRHHCGFEP